MTPEQVQSLKFAPANPGLKGSDLANQTDRTLLYGYTHERLSVHVYLLAGVLHQLVSTSLRGTRTAPALENVVVSHRDESSVYFSGDDSLWVPDKRAYPELCDFEFCSRLARSRVDIPFTTFGLCKSADRKLPTHRDVPTFATARMSDAFHIAGVEKGSVRYRATFENQALFNQVVGKYHFHDIGSEPASWIILEEDIEALAREILHVTDSAPVLTD